MVIHAYMLLMRKSNIGIILLISALLVCITMYAGNSDIKFPKETVEGYLDNGFHYIILPNKLPEAKAEIRLVMRIGSLQEEEGEKGCAHFLEHIAFGGTANFPNRMLVEALENTGMKYGIDINAFTGFDRTIYMFAVPLDQGQKNIDLSLNIVRDWMDGMTIDSVKVEREKGIILEELRGYDFGDDFYSLKIGKGIYSRRIPLGSSQDILRVNYKILRNFYKKHYKASSASLVIVGDVNALELRKDIQKTFSSLPKHISSLNQVPLEYEKGVILSQITDTLRPNAILDLMIPHKSAVVRTIEDAVKKEQGAMIVKALSARMNTLGIKCNISDKWYLSDINHFSITIESQSKEQLISSVTAVSSQIKDIITNGLDPAELYDLKEAFIKKMPIEETKNSSSEWCENFIEYIAFGDKSLSDIKQKKLVCHRIQNTKNRDIKKILSSWWDSRQTVLAAFRTPSESWQLLTGQEINDALVKGEKSGYIKYDYKKNVDKEDKPLNIPDFLTQNPVFDKSKIISDITYPNTKIREISLKNGIKLILKSVPEYDKVLMLSSFAPFGLSSLSAEEYPLLEGAAGYMDMGGVDKLKGEEYYEYLYRNEMSLGIMIDNHFHGFMGASPEQFSSEFFRLLYEKIYFPELNYKDFESTRSEQLNEFGKENFLEKMLKSSPERIMDSRIKVLIGETLLKTSPDAEHLKKLDFAQITAYYKELYGRPEGSTYIITGNFDADSVARKFVSIFGNIPESDAPCRFSYPHFDFPNGGIIECIQGDDETKTAFDFVLTGHYQPCVKNTLILKIMRELIRNRLISVLREQHSLVYSPYISLSYSSVPWKTFYFDINASSENENLNEIINDIRLIVKDLQTTKVTQSELDAIKRSFLIAKREDLNNENAASWRNAITNVVKNGESLYDFDRYEEILSLIGPEILLDSFKKYIDINNSIFMYISKKSIEL